MFKIHIYCVFQTYAEMDPTTAALEKEHEAVSKTKSSWVFPWNFKRGDITLYEILLIFGFNKQTFIMV